MDREERISILNENVYIENEDESVHKNMYTLAWVIYALYGTFLICINVVITGNLNSLTPDIKQWHVPIIVIIFVMTGCLCFYLSICYYIHKAKIETRINGHPIIATSIIFILTFIGLNTNICGSIENQGFVPCLPAFSIIFSFLNILFLGIIIFLKVKKITTRKVKTDIIISGTDKQQI